MLNDIQSARMRRMFQAYDANHDEFLTLEDFTTHAYTLSAARGDAVDPAGLIATLTGFWSALADAADTDRDGRVSSDEFMAFAGRITADLQQAADAGAPWPLAGWIDSLYQIIDADGDGRIDAQEYARWIGALGLAGDTDTDAAFRGFDKNADGYLSREEFALANQQFWLSHDASAPGHRLIGP
jgi:Ca2+-binding EF-hand superfamily protein